MINLNREILRQCREQMNMSFADVLHETGIKIEAVESGKAELTFEEMDRLSDIYHVPRWVFITDKLPKEYNYSPLFKKVFGK